VNYVVYSLLAVSSYHRHVSSFGILAARPCVAYLHNDK